jgi:hypothetical protein
MDLSTQPLRISRLKHSYEMNMTSILNKGGLFVYKEYRINQFAIRKYGYQIKEKK